MKSGRVVSMTPLASAMRELERKLDALRGQAVRPIQAVELEELMNGEDDEDDDDEGRSDDDAAVGGVQAGRDTARSSRCSRSAHECSDAGCDVHQVGRGASASASGPRHSRGGKAVNVEVGEQSEP